ncbi:MAG: hypothetical protein JOY81_14120 [Alphaproteobacteria bacterium]|nr:hypothetical protein [Alphaproteobacteria bacterium]
MTNDQERDKPRGLTGPLSQAQLSSLRDLASGAITTLPDDHRVRLLHLELIEEQPDGFAVTEVGHKRLVSDR